MYKNPQLEYYRKCHTTKEFKEKWICNLREKKKYHSGRGWSRLQGNKWEDYCNNPGKKWKHGLRQ